MTEPDPAGQSPDPVLGNARHIVDAGLYLLDRQILDKDGKLVGKVDDLELVIPKGKGAPFVAAILGGPEALGARVGGRLGRLMQATQRRLRPHGQGGPAKISFGVVTRIIDHVEIGVSTEELSITQLDRWVRDHAIGRIPGASHATE
jgi:sporulation protein YlmC with PRC-barrel domain